MINLENEKRHAETKCLMAILDSDTIEQLKAAGRMLSYFTQLYGISEKLNHTYMLKKIYLHVPKFLTSPDINEKQYVIQ